VRVSKPGNYSRDENLSIFLAIEPGDPRLPAEIQGSIQRPRRWCRISSIGANVMTFNQYIASIVTSIDAQPLPLVGIENRIFLWDNLRAHKSPILYETVERGGRHRIQCRPPYMPCDGPFEYIFCQLECVINKRMSHISSTEDLAIEIRNIVGNLGGFDSTFAHCGYTP